MGLEEFRKKIDETDYRLLDILSERMSIISDLAEYKKYHKIPIIDTSREGEVIKDRKRKAKAKSLSDDFIEKIFDDILRESKKVQRDIF